MCSFAVNEKSDRDRIESDTRTDSALRDSAIFFQVNEIITRQIMYANEDKQVL